eukprot:11228316-Lingulodinium_polyedra.AAC.2
MFLPFGRPKATESAKQIAAALRATPVVEPRPRGSRKGSSKQSTRFLCQRSLWHPRPGRQRARRAP